MRLLRRRRPAGSYPGYPGIILRISTINGVVVEADSEHLFHAARYSGAPDGWLNLIAGQIDGPGELIPSGEFSVVPLKIEIKPVQLGIPDA